MIFTPLTSTLPVSNNGYGTSVSFLLLTYMLCLPALQPWNNRHLSHFCFIQGFRSKGQLGMVVHDF